MDDTAPYIAAFWREGGQTYGEFVMQTREFLLALREIDPIFETLYVMGDRENHELPLGANLEYLETLVYERGWDRNAPRDWYTELDEREEPTMDTLSPVGWGLSIVTEPERECSDNYVHLSMHTGATSARLKSRIVVQAGNARSPLAAIATADRLFRLVIDFWDPDGAQLTSADFRDAVWDDETHEQLGWLTYRKDPSFARHLPAGVFSEDLADGVLFRIGDGQPLDATCTDEIRVGRAIQESLRAGSLPGR